MSTDASRAVAAFIAGTRFDDLPPGTVDMASRCLLDAIGVSLAAGTLGEGCAAFLALAAEAPGESRILGFDRKAPAADAAFVNGALAHALDFEDTHDGALVHPNAATVPAALALSEALDGRDGRDLITAIAVGCDVVCRLGLALRVPLDDFGWYPPPILGTFGAAAAAASLCRLDEQRCLDALSLALCQASCSAEIKHSPRSLIRAVRDAFPARAGVVAARLAADGVVGFERPLDGEAGFFRLFARGHHDPGVLTDGLGERFEIERVTFKRWPSCRGTHAFIEAALALSAAHGLQRARITRIVARGNRINRMLAEPADSKRAPATAIDARFSIPYTVASAMLRGEPGLEHFEPDALLDPRVRALAARVVYEVDPGLDDGPGSMTRGELIVETSTGRHATTVPAGEARSVAGVDRQALEAKFMACAARAAVPKPPQARRALLSAINGVAGVQDLRGGLFALL